MREIRIDSNTASQRLDKFLKRYLPEAGGSFLYKQLRKKNITLNGAKAKGSEILRADDVIRIFFSDETIRKFEGISQSNDLITAHASDDTKQIHVTDFKNNIIYEDAHVLLMNKPAGLLSQKAEKNDISLVEEMQSYLFAEGKLQKDDLRLYSPGVVNRLDRNTSGLVLGAKTLPASRILSIALKERTLQKYYYALVIGEVQSEASVKAWIRKDAASNRVTVSEEKHPDAALIETRYLPIAVRKVSRGDGAPELVTLLKVELITGKTHQIRGHLAYIGHPIVGDVKYGVNGWNRYAKMNWGLERQFLHAAEIHFPDMEEPVDSLSGQTFSAPIPQDLHRVLHELKMTGEITFHE